MEFPREVRPCGGDTSEKELMRTCMDALAESQPSIMLVGNELDLGDTRVLVEILFDSVESSA